MAMKTKSKPKGSSSLPRQKATPSRRGEGSYAGPRTKPAGSKKPPKPGVPTSLRKPAAKTWQFGRDGFIPDKVMDAGMLAASVLGAGKVGLAGKAIKSVKAISKAKPKPVKKGSDSAKILPPGSYPPRKVTKGKDSATIYYPPRTVTKGKDSYTIYYPPRTVKPAPKRTKFMDSKKGAFTKGGIIGAGAGVVGASGPKRRKIVKKK
jgi:hypothetical protein